MRQVLSGSSEEDVPSRDVSSVEDRLVEVLLLLGYEVRGSEGSDLIDEEGFVARQEVDPLRASLLEGSYNVVVRGHLYDKYVPS